MQSQQEMLSSPEAFTRPVNRAQTFTPFNMLPVTDMEDFLRDVIHPRPAVLSTHDVQPEDWGRLMNVSASYIRFDRLVPANANS